MILEMAKVRVLGPLTRLGEVIAAIQDLGLVHLLPPPDREGLRDLDLSCREERWVHYLETGLEDVEVAGEHLGITGSQGPDSEGAEETVETLPLPEDLPGQLRFVRRARRGALALRSCRIEREEERALLLKYRDYWQAWQSLLSPPRTQGESARHPFLLVLRNDGDRLAELRRELGALSEDGFELLHRRLADGSLAVVLLTDEDASEEVDRLLERAGVQQLRLPPSIRQESGLERIAGLQRRLREAERELKEVDEEIVRRASDLASALGLARALFHDRLSRLEARRAVATTARAFALDGFVPLDELARLQSALTSRFAGAVVVERIGSERWQGEEPPVVLSNPRLFRPFETLTGLLPLPRYGTIDPTPFVAVFFPMFFGLMLGDVGYGAVLALVALILRLRSKKGTRRRAIAEVAGACSAFSILFGVLFGEYFGDLGRRWLGLQPLAFDREEALMPFLLLVVALGLVHVLIGLVLGAVGAFRSHRRESFGKGLAVLMILLIVTLLLAAFGILPRAFFTPLVIVLLIAFPVLIVLEGMIAPIEFLSTLGNVLSYARIMALGTASVTMAVVANRMVGSFGSLAVGVVFALLFHLVNFALGVFGPTVHALRLHYVEFYGKFYSPGGAEYRPLVHWHDDQYAH